MPDPLSLPPFHCHATIELVVKRMKIRFLVVSLILILSLSLSAGCEILPEVETSTPSNPPTSDATTPIDSDWELSPSESQAPILPSIADVVAKVKPSVVTINTEVVHYDFFNQPFTQEGAGSGWIISEDGIIITNNHVVKGAESVTVTLDDGRTLPADMDTVVTDWLTDLAVFRIDAENLPAATVGESAELRVGDWVVAIGNSLGEGIRATQGIVSRQDVSVQVDQGQTLYGLIETDAAINPGNSGGPLVNMAGEVIGINSVKLIDIQVEGVGYAIGTSEAMPIIQQLINNGYVIRPWLGVGLYTVDEYVVFRYGLAVDTGVLVTNVAAGSPADEAGLRAGDVITEFGDQEMIGVDELIRTIHSSEIGQAIEITYWRGDTKSTAWSILAESPPPP